MKRRSAIESGDGDGNVNSDFRIGGMVDPGVLRRLMGL